MKKMRLLLLILLTCISMSACEMLDTVVYNKGIDALNAQEWDKAIAHFSGLDFKDSTELLKLCEKEKGMHEHSDYEFLAALEDAVRARQKQVEKNADPQTLINTEWAVLNDIPYDFYDNELRKIADSYIYGLGRQETSLNYKYANAQQIWTEGMVVRMEALNALHEKYGIFKDDTDFKRDYILALPRIQDQYKKLQVISKDLRSQLNYPDYKIVNTYTISIPYNNTTSYDFDLQFYFTFYDQNHVRVDDYITYISDIKANEECRFKFNCPKTWMWKDFECHWEIFPH